MKTYESWSFLSGPHRVVALTETPDADWVRTFEPLAREGVGVEVGDDGNGAVAEISLAALEPIVEHLDSVFIASRRKVSGAEVLDRAARLRALGVYAAVQQPIAVNRLGSLNEFQGVVNRFTRSALENEHVGLMTLRLGGRQSLPPISSPLRELTQVGGVGGLPNLARPGDIVSYERAGAREFDLAELMALPNLRSFRLERCPKVINVESVNVHPSVENVMFQDCSTSDSWENLKTTLKLDLLFVQPRPSERFAAETRNRGGTVWNH